MGCTTNSNTGASHVCADATVRWSDLCELHSSATQLFASMLLCPCLPLVCLCRRACVCMHMHARVEQYRTLCAPEVPWQILRGALLQATILYTFVHLCIYSIPPGSADQCLEHARSFRFISCWCTCCCLVVCGGGTPWQFHLKYMLSGHSTYCCHQRSSECACFALNTRAVLCMLHAGCILHLSCISVQGSNNRIQCTLESCFENQFMQHGPHRSACHSLKTSVQSAVCLRMPPPHACRQCSAIHQGIYSLMWLENALISASESIPMTMPSETAIPHLEPLELHGAVQTLS